MKAAAYCRVSTNKNEQMDSLSAQRNFFIEYTQHHHLTLVHIYADEGKSGTKMKNRTQLLQLMADAKKGMFDTVLIKDVSRLARNTVDFLVSIRTLRALHVDVIFVNYDQTSSDSSEFMLTMLSAIAQEESANTSKRVKFGKEINAKLGRVPNLVFGYDKKPGDYFNLSINTHEAQTVHRIFTLYTKDKLSAGAIARLLNAQGCQTKRGCAWSQNAVSRILHNAIYTGQIINGREEVINFLTGQRAPREKERWHYTHRPEMQIIDEGLFSQANAISAVRAPIGTTKHRTSHCHAFSQLLSCQCCGHSFRRLGRPGAKTAWVCAGRNTYGAYSCSNKSAPFEEALLLALQSFVCETLEKKADAFHGALRALAKEQLQNARGNTPGAEREKLLQSKRKYIQMYEADIITLAELEQKSKTLALRLHELENSMPLSCTPGESSDMKSFFPLFIFTNSLLRQLFQKIMVSPQGRVDFYFTDLKEQNG